MPLFKWVWWLGVWIYILCPILKSVSRYLLFHNFCLKNFLALSCYSFPKFIKQIPLLCFYIYCRSMRCSTIRRANLNLILFFLPRLYSINFTIIRSASLLLLYILEVQLGVWFENLIFIFGNRFKFRRYRPFLHKSPLSCEPWLWNSTLFRRIFSGTPLTFILRSIWLFLRVRSLWLFDVNFFFYLLCCHISWAVVVWGWRICV